MELFGFTYILTLRPKHNWSKLIQCCPGFGWDRVNFHKKPVRDTARQADPNWPNKRGIWYPVPPGSVLSGGSWPGRGQLHLGCTLGIGQWERVPLCIPLFLYILLFSIGVTVCFLRCSVKLPLSWPMSFAFFFPFCSAPQQGEGRQSDHVVLWCQPGLNYDKCHP